MRRIPRITTFSVLAGFALLAAVLPLVVALLALVSGAKQQSDARVSEVLQTAARQISGQLSTELAQLWRAHTALAEIVARGEVGPSLMSRLDTAKLLNADLAWTGVAAPDGRVLIATGGLLQGLDVSARPWFRAGLQGNYAGDMHAPLLLGRHLPPSPDGEATRLIDFASPVLRADGSTLGVLGTHIDASWLRKLMREALAVEQAELMLVSRDGTVLAGPSGLVGQRLGARAVLSAQQGVAATSIESWQDGASYVTVAMPIAATDGRPAFGWSIVIRQNPARMAAIARELLRAVGAPLAGTSMLVFAAGLLIAWKVTRPLQQLARAAASLSEGGLDRPIPESRTTVEMSMLADALARLDRKEPATGAQLREAA